MVSTEANPIARSRSAQFLETLQGYQRVIVVMHDNPDPDAIAAGWGLRVLIEEKLGKEVRLVGSGAIVRAENRHMVDLLGPPMELVQEIACDNDTAVVLVDCGLGTSNHVVTRQNLIPVAIVDHHLGDETRAGQVPFADLRPDVAASASIVATYLHEQGIDPGHKLATAMVYAIRTETRGFETHHSELDRAILPWLTEWADPALVAEIESAPLTREYFGDLVLALQCTQIFGDVVFCLSPRAQGAELVGELADLLVRCRSIQRVLIAAVVAGDLVVSVRTEREEDCAATLIQSALAGLGSAGGHGHRAGGKVAGIGADSAADVKLKEQLLDRWLTACGVEDRRGVPLISRHEIIRHL